MKFLKRKITKIPVVNKDCDCGSKLATYDCTVYKRDGRIVSEHLCIECIKVGTINGDYIAL